ncbi:hypothetical protein H7J87_11810 [Mycolicibacterium wolinskyi]|uniref:Uncharacterized protein n=1 Tax=Mycolicibacterium wolinskyi TaxID=59750 RepID=A0A1X2FJ33_9MYCO|nr:MULTISPECIES: hypothetical protein [Mycolicibacterium]MCV7286016.1 hypothetical protein [Mycolicibacterium wolinskyi]MCV7296212.1 hypothetical protein [Mycolicibacterium goodii]ORX18444.1 hypothetical protein AWC31_14165 [Mycolicibacterium wolinskyi]
MSGDDRQSTADLADVLLDLGAAFRRAVDGLTDHVRPDGIDPSTHAALGDSKAKTQEALDDGAKVSDKGRKFTKDVEEQARESAEDINGVDAKTELSSGHVPGGAPAGQLAPPAPSMTPQPQVWGMAAPSQQMPMPAMGGGMGGGGTGMGGGGGGFSFPSFSSGTGSVGGGGSQSGSGVREAAAHTRVGGPAVFQNLDAQQVQNAKEIVNAGLRRGDVSRDDIQIALMTALTESGIRRLANPAVPESLLIENDGEGYDHDSTGPFQQRQTWGDTADLMDPASSADKFFDKLVTIPNRDQMSMGAVAQAVQVSAFPDAYAKHEKQAGQLLDAIFAS